MDPAYSSLNFGLGETLDLLRDTVRRFARRKSRRGRL